MTADAVKAGALLVFAALVQVSIASAIEVAEGHPDVVLVLVIGIALLRGPVFGAVAGFWAGLVLDVVSLETLGLTSLLLTLAGYFAGRLGDVVAWFHCLRSTPSGTCGRPARWAFRYASSPVDARTS